MEIRKIVKFEIQGCEWWTYEQERKYYLVANDNIMAEFKDEHSIEIFERDLCKNDEEKN